MLAIIVDKISAKYDFSIGRKLYWGPKVTMMSMMSLQTEMFPRLALVD